MAIKLIGFDVETDGVDPAFALQPWRVPQAWLSSAAWSVDGVDDAHWQPDAADLRPLLEQWAKSGRYIVGWNTAFDVSWLLALGLREEVFACRWLDAMLLYRHVSNAPPWHPVAVKTYGLKAAVATHLPDVGDYSKDVEFHEKRVENLSEWRTALTTYNKLDASLTVRLAEKFLAEMTPAQRRVALAEARSIPLVAEANVRGVCVDTAAAAALSEDLTRQSKKAFVQLALTAGTTITPELLASPTQLRDLLYETWNLPATQFTETGVASTDREALLDLAALDDRASLINDYREAVNNNTKFCSGVLASAAYSGGEVSHPSARIFGTYTGRMTYSSGQGRGKAAVPTGIALHQWKRDPAFRKLICAPDGYTMLEFDFAGQEFRWMAVESRDETMLGLCAPGEDAHAYMGARIGKTDYRLQQQELLEKEPGAKRLRQLGKVANLSLQYRTGATRLQSVAWVQHGLRMTAAEARAITATYRTAYPGVPRYWMRQEQKARKTGVISTLGGRRIFLGMDNGDPQGPANLWRDNDWGLTSTAINFPIQGVGADQKYLALLVLRDYLPKVDGRFYFELHDGLFVVVPDRYREQAVREIKQLLSNLPYEKAWGVDLPIQFPVDAKLGKSWGELKEWNE